MNIHEFLKETYSIHKVGGYQIQDVRPKVICNDGFSISVQGSKYHYSTPRKDGYKFTHVELGYPSEYEVWMLEHLGLNINDEVGGYIPIEKVQELLDRHGGILEGCVEKSELAEKLIK